MIKKHNNILLLDKCHICGEPNDSYYFCLYCGSKISDDTNIYAIEKNKTFLKCALKLEHNYYSILKIGEHIENEISSTEKMAYSHFTFNTADMSENEISEANNRIASAQNFSRNSIPELQNLLNEYALKKIKFKNILKEFYNSDSIVPVHCRSIIPVMMFNHYLENDICITVNQCIDKYKNEKENGIIMSDLYDTAYDPEKAPELIYTLKNDTDSILKHLEAAHKNAIAFEIHDIQIYVAAVTDVLQKIENESIKTINKFKSMLMEEK